MKLTVIIPVYNERRTIRKFWQTFQMAPFSKCDGVDAVEVIIIDDGSTDGTSDELVGFAADDQTKKFEVATEVILLKNKDNCGKGASIRKGVDRSSGDVVIIQDADLEYSPVDYPNMINPITEGNADAVYGSRFAGHTRRVLFFWHAFANKALTFLANLLLNLNFSDIETCYKAVNGNLLRSLKLTSNRFGIEPELTARLARSKARLYEVPISYYGRTYEAGKKFTKMDGFLAFLHVLKFALIDREAFKPGLNQTLGALDKLNDLVYRPILDESLQKITLPAKKRLNILEIGCGIGSLTPRLLELGDVVAVDIEKDYVEQLKNRFDYSSDIKSAVWDATKPLDENLTPKDGFDLIVCFNVLEHIEKDKEALINWKNLLSPDGHMIVLVPHYPSLFNEIDKAAGHYRRYTKDSLAATFDKAGFRVGSVFTGNSLGLVGWAVTKFTKQDRISSNSLLVYSILKHTLGLLEHVANKFTGLSVIAIGQKET